MRRLICFVFGHILRIRAHEITHAEYWYPEYDEYVCCERCEQEWSFHNVPETFWLRLKELFYREE